MAVFKGCGAGGSSDLQSNIYRNPLCAVMSWKAGCLPRESCRSIPYKAGYLHGNYGVAVTLGRIPPGIPEENAFSSRQARLVHLQRFADPGASRLLPCKVSRTGGSRRRASRLPF